MAKKKNLIVSPEDFLNFNGKDPQNYTFLYLYKKQIARDFYVFVWSAVVGIFWMEWYDACSWVCTCVCVWNSNRQTCSQLAFPRFLSCHFPCAYFRLIHSMIVYTLLRVQYIPPLDWYCLNRNSVCYLFYVTYAYVSAHIPLSDIFIPQWFVNSSCEESCSIRVYGIQSSVVQRV